MLENKDNFRKEFIKEAKQAIGLKSMAYKDYLAARKLLNADMLHQAAFLIDTCIEKELKTYLFARKINFKSTHEIQRLFGIIYNLHDVSWISKINSEFIKVISKIYKSRYYEVLGPGYNFVINKNKFLAELDYTYSELEETTTLKSESNPDGNTAYKSDLKTRNPLLYENNYILNNISKEDFLNKPEIVFEFRIAETHQPWEVLYKIPKNEDTTTFNYEGLKQLDGQSFKLSQVGKKEL